MFIQNYTGLACKLEMSVDLDLQAQYSTTKNIFIQQSKKKTTLLAYIYIVANIISCLWLQEA